MFSRGVLEFSKNDWVAGKKGRFPNDVRSLEATNKSFCQMIALGFDVIEPR